METKRAPLGDDLCSASIDCVRTFLSTHLQASRKALREALMPQIDAELKSCQSCLAAAKLPAHIDLGEFLYENIKSAVHDLISWLRTDGDIASSDPFLISDVAKIELFVSTRCGMDDVNYKLAFVELRGLVERRLTSEPKISGWARPAFALMLENLIVNAFRHSGLAATTRLNMKIGLGKGLIVVDSRNSISAERQRALRPSWNDILRRSRLRDDVTAEASRKGFPAIRRICAGIFGVEPEIYLDKGAIEKKQFRVVLRIRHGKTDLTEAGYASSDRRG